MSYANNGAITATPKNPQSALVGTVAGTGEPVYATALNKKALEKVYKENAKQIKNEISKNKATAESDLKESYHTALESADEELKKQKADAITEQKALMKQSYEENLATNKENYNNLLDEKTKLETAYNTSITDAKNTLTKATTEITNETGEAWTEYQNAVKQSMENTYKENNNGVSYLEEIQSWKNEAFKDNADFYNKYVGSSYANIVSKLEKGETVDDLLKNIGSGTTATYLKNWNNSNKEVINLANSYEKQWDTALKESLESNKKAYLQSYETQINTFLDENTKIYNESMNTINKNIDEFNAYFLSAPTDYQNAVNDAVNEINTAYNNAYNEYATEQYKLYNEGLTDIEKQVNTALQSSRDSVNKNYVDTMAYYGVNLPKGSKLYSRKISVRKLRARKIRAPHIRMRMYVRNVPLKARYVKRLGKLRLHGTKVKPTKLKLPADMKKVAKRNIRKYGVRKVKYNKVIHTKNRGKLVYKIKITRKIRPVKSRNARKFPIRKK